MRAVARCGTRSGFQRHLAEREQPCDPCRDANRSYGRAHYRRTADVLAALTPKLAQLAALRARAAAAEQQRVDAEQEYRTLADAVIAAFNPPDSDTDEVAILTDCISNVREYIEHIPCECIHTHIPSVGAVDPCWRCITLGRVANLPDTR